MKLGKHQLQNSIHSLDTKIVYNAQSEAVPVIVMGLNIGEVAAAPQFIDSVLERFKNRRMLSPTNTRNMVVTVAGAITAEQFCQLWAERSVDDTVVQFFLSLMVKADVLHIQGNNLLDSASIPRTQASEEVLKMLENTRSKLLRPDAALAQIAGSEPLAQEEIVNRIWSYIRERGLCDKSSNRIVADAVLKPLFDGEDFIDMFRLSKAVENYTSH